MYGICWINDHSKWICLNYHSRFNLFDCKLTFPHFCPTWHLYSCWNIILRRGFSFALCIKKSPTAQTFKYPSYSSSYYCMHDVLLKCALNIFKRVYLVVAHFALLLNFQVTFEATTLVTLSNPNCLLLNKLHWTSTAPVFRFYFSIAFQW